MILILLIFRNEYLFLLTLFLIPVAITNFNIFLSANYGYTYYSDIILRSNLNDTLINRYYYFWTNFYVLPFFYFNCYLLVVFMYTQWISIVQFTLITNCLILYNLEVFDFFALNANTWITDYSRLFINTLLTNALNNYHPFIFYVGTLYLYVIVYINFLQSLNVLISFHLNLLIAQSNYLNYYILLVFMITLFMGSWWALQEGSWGGWWDWDPSEMLGLLFLTITLINTHTNIIFQQFYSFYEQCLLLLLLTLLCYLLVQLNFELVSHNFGINSFFLFNNNSIFFEFLFIVTIYFVWKFNNVLVLNTSWLNLSAWTYNPLLNQGVYKNFIVFVISLLMLYFFLSFLPLMNYFALNTLSLDLVGVNNLIYTLNITTLLTFLFFFSTTIFVNLVLLPLFVIVFDATSFIFLYFFTYSNSRLSIWIHVIVIQFFYLNFHISELQMSSWLLTNQLNDIITNSNYIIPTSTIYSCDTTYINLISTYIDNLGTSLLGWTSVFLANTTETENFLLSMDTTSLWNSYELSFAPYSISNNIIYPGLQNILVVFYIILFGLFTRINNNFHIYLY